MQCRNCGHVYERMVGKIVGVVAVPLLALVFGKKMFRSEGSREAAAAGGLVVGGALGHPCGDRRGSGGVAQLLVLA